jgi:hypothetical protein
VRRSSCQLALQPFVSIPNARECARFSDFRDAAALPLPVQILGTQTTDLFLRSLGHVQQVVGK